MVSTENFPAVTVQHADEQGSKSGNGLELLRLLELVAVVCLLEKLFDHQFHALANLEISFAKVQANGKGSQQVLKFFIASHF